MDRLKIQHELRTPTGVILGYAELLDDQVMSVDEVRQAVNSIKRCAKKLNAAIDELMAECAQQEAKEQAMRILLRCKIIGDDYDEISGQRAVAS